MNLIQINELRQLINLEYPHICLDENDLAQFLNIPWEAKRFYRMKIYRDTDRKWVDKRGFFHNGKTTVWATYPSYWVKNDPVKPIHIRIADKEIPTAPNGAYWSKDFSYEEEGSANRIMRMMKLKAFW